MAAATIAAGELVRGTVFYKMTGSGNDFVMLDGRATSIDEWDPARIAAICRRREGVGADGLVILTPQDHTSVRMLYFNADGSRAAMCGNAALCSTRLAAHLELGPATGMCLVTDAGVVETRCAPGTDQAEIRLPDCTVPHVTAFPTAPGEHRIWLGTVGVPHLIVLVDDVGRVDVAGRGRALRFDPAAGPEGANANFVAPPMEMGAPWLIRTYERGVEGETLACGTGIVAAALTLAAHRATPLPIEFRSRSGEILSVRATLHGDLAVDIWLRGQGRLVFRGVWEG